MRFSRQEYWSGLPFPPAGDLPNPGIKPKAPAAPELQRKSAKPNLPPEARGPEDSTVCLCSQLRIEVRWEDTSRASCGTHCKGLWMGSWGNELGPPCSNLGWCLDHIACQGPSRPSGRNRGLPLRRRRQGILPTQGLIPGLPHIRWILYQLSHQGSPRILEW